MQLNYADGSLYRSKSRRRVIAFALTGLTVLYAASWLGIASSAKPQSWMINDHTEYWKRVPGYEGWLLPFAAIYEPAFIADAYCRPKYWRWTKEITPWPPPALRETMPDKE